jgi:pyrroloquinoline quinone biosynthesis protein B
MFRHIVSALSALVLAFLPIWLLACGPGWVEIDTERSSEPSSEPASDARIAKEDRGAVDGPRVVVLGTVQDGGLPHASCHGPHCEAARNDPSRRRYVASLGIVLPQSKKLYLVDATPDVIDQIDLLSGYREPSLPPGGTVDRSPLDGIFLTHAHMGHYLGLAHFGFEAVNTRDLPAWGTPRMLAFLRSNGPWDQLVTKKNLELREMPLSDPGMWERGEVHPDAGTRVELGEGVAVAAFPVPHRDEYSDTVAYVIRGPRRTVLYVPDTDGWGEWPRPLPEVLKEGGIDVALLDGTFFSMDELPGRDITQVRHPLMRQTMDLLEEPVRRGELEVAFTHLNHTNPALEPEGPERREIEQRGFRVLAEGEEVGL